MAERFPAPPVGEAEIGAWSPNHLDARRFARREDAACMLTWHCGDVGRVAEHMWTPMRPPVTDTPQGCPTCGGPRPCDRCTTRNVVDVDALKARLESERLRAAAEIVKLIADDSWAIAFQSLGQYRSALLKAWRDSAPAAPPQEDQ